jgi:nucleotide-binding universal stress UspA family protein
MLMFANIVVCIDDSASARRALDNGIELARAADSGSLTLITVAPHVSSLATLLQGVSSETLRVGFDKWAADLLANAVALVPEGVAVRTLQRVGHAGPEIMKALEDAEYDLVVFGSSGQGRVGTKLLGSVASHLFFHCHLPLLCVPD